MRRFERKIEFDAMHSTVKATEEAVREVLRLLMAATGDSDTP